MKFLKQKFDCINGTLKYRGYHKLFLNSKMMNKMLSVCSILFYIFKEFQQNTLLKKQIKLIYTQYKLLKNN